MDVPLSQEGPNMQGRLMSHGCWRVSGERITISVLVVGVHLGLVMLLLRAPRVSPQASLNDASASKDVLRVRFLRRERPKSAAEPAPIFLPHPRQRSALKAPIARAPLRSVSAPATVLLPAKIEPGNAPTDVAATYTAGGGFLERAARDAPSDNIHLPGSSQAIVKGLHMVDPRYQGIAGAVRVVQSVFGVVKPHCVDVDIWRGMSVRELLDRHMSPDQVEKTAEEYRCGPG
jgi:hypothetical protein